MNVFTDDDLRDACRELADETPEVAPLLARLEHRRVRRPGRSVAAPALAALAIAILAVTLAVVLGTDHARRPTVPADGGPTASHPCDATAVGRPDLMDVSMRQVSGLASFSQSTSICSGYAERELDVTAGGDVGFVRQYREGVFDTGLLADARRVSGHGIDGYLATVTQRRLSPDQPPMSFACDEYVVPESSSAGGSLRHIPGCRNQAPTVLAWEYAPDSWALVADQHSPFGDPFFGDEPSDDLLRVAAAVETAHPAPVRIPVRFERLPEQLRAVGVVVFRNRVGRLLSADVELGAVGVPRCRTGTACTIGEVALTTPSHAPRLTGKPIAVRGRTAYLTDQGGQRPDITLRLWTGRWQVLVAQTSDRPVDDGELVAVARSASYAPSTATATWFPLQDALPR